MLKSHQEIPPNSGKMTKFDLLSNIWLIENNNVLKIITCFQKKMVGKINKFRDKNYLIEIKWRNIVIRGKD